MTAGFGARAVAQAVVFILISRTLGVENYGAFAAILALASVLGSFGALGTQVVLLREVSRTPDMFSSAWGKTLLTIAFSTPILWIAYLCLASWLLPDEVSMAVIALIGLADIVLVPLTLSTVTAYTALERMDRAAFMTLLPVVPRFFSAIVLLALSSVLPSQRLLIAWVILYALSALVAATYSQILARRELGKGDRPEIDSLWPTIRQGLPFVAGAAALKTHNEIDKTLLSRLASLESAGAYSAGHRVADLAAIPIVSLLTTAWPRFFRAGEQGWADTFRLARALLPIPAAYALLAGAGLFYFADFLPLLLGPEFAMASDALRWLAWLPLVSLPRYFLNTMLNSSNKQHVALRALLIGAGVNIGLNLWWIPLYGWQGAVMATYIAELLMFGAMLLHRTGTPAR